LLDFGEYFIVITQHTVAFGIKAVSYLEADHLTFESGDFRTSKISCKQIWIKTIMHGLKSFTFMQKNGGNTRSQLSKL